MRNWHTNIVLLTLLGMITGCSDGDSGKTFEFPDFDINIQTDPETLQVGKDADIRVSIIDTSEEHAAKSGCGVKFRQYMPGMQMDNDDIYIDMKEAENGVYQGRSGEFSMGGDWVIEFDIKCQDETHTVPIPYHLEWPE
jgi:YtkA-like